MGSGVFVVTEKDYRKIMSGPCASCGGTDDITLDHIVPVARGGRHSVGNLQALCRGCNASKGAKLVMEWKAQKDA